MSVGDVDIPHVCTWAFTAAAWAGVNFRTGVSRERGIRGAQAIGIPTHRGETPSATS